MAGSLGSRGNGPFLTHVLASRIFGRRVNAEAGRFLRAAERAINIAAKENDKKARREAARPTPGLPWSRGHGLFLTHEWTACSY